MTKRLRSTPIKTIQLFVAMLLICASRAQASSITSGYYMQTFTDAGGIGQWSVNWPAQAGVSESATVPLTQHTESVSGETSTAMLYGSAVPDTYHGYVQSLASVTSPGTSVNGPNASSNLEFISSDDLLFTSSTLAIGTPVSFLLTADLHSTLTADTTGSCSGVASTPAGSASLQIVYNNGNNYGAYLFSPLNHNTCGGGSDSMSFTGTFQSEVGNGAVSSGDPGDFAIQTYFILNSGAHVSDFTIGSDTTTVDASSTGNIYIQVLTPGVTFSSASGATYEPAAASPVPEPATLTLTVLGVGGMLTRYRRRRSR